MDRQNPGANLANAVPTGEPGSAGFRAVGVAVARLAAPILAKRGAGRLGRLKAAWPAVAGIDWAACAWPTALGSDGALKLRVVPSAALELQHRAPHLIERVNLYLGGTVVTRLVLRQALPPPAPVAAPSPPRPLTAAESAALAASLRGVADPELRAALDGLGRAALGSQPAVARLAPDPETG